MFAKHLNWTPASPDQNLNRVTAFTGQEEAVQQIADTMIADFEVASTQTAGAERAVWRKP